MGKKKRKRRGLLLLPAVTPNLLRARKAVMKKTSAILRRLGERVDPDQGMVGKVDAPEKTEEIDLETVPEEISEAALEKRDVIRSVVAGEADQDLDNHYLNGVFLN